jgi:phosphoribosylformylglycinamidine synthase
VTDVRQGKLFEIQVDATDRAAAERLARELCQKLLANPVIEDWRIERIEG